MYKDTDKARLQVDIKKETLEKLKVFLNATLLNKNGVVNAAILEYIKYHQRID